MKAVTYFSCLCSAVALTSAAPLTTPNPAAVLLPRQQDSQDSLSCAASSWPPITVGVVNGPQAPDANLTALLSQVSADNIGATINKLASFTTRATLSVNISNATYGIGGARDWLFDQFSSFAAANPDSGLQVSLNSYIQEPDDDRVLFPVNISNVVATLPGTSYQSPSNPGRVYVISGHYDSRNTDPLNYEDPAPGADDDASGVSLSLELARVFSSPGAPRLSPTLVFVAVAGEEQNLYGANNLAFTYRNSTPPINVEGMLNCDTVGSPNARNTYDTGNANSSSAPNVIRLFAQGIPPLTAENATVRARRLSYGADSDSPARNLARLIKEVSENTATNMSVVVINRLDRFGRGGDHTPFLNAGYPAVRFTEPYEDYRHQHQDVRMEVDPQYPDQGPVQYGDLPEFVDFEYTARVGRVNLAALYSLAMSPGVPQNPTVNITTLRNDVELAWDPPVEGEENVGAYEVVWRPTTAALWERVLDVGMGEEVAGSDTGRKKAVVGVSVDNVVFGIRARSVDGYRGVATWPFPFSDNQ